MKNREIGRFYAKTFNNKHYEFVIKEDGYIYCNLLENQKIRKMIIKSRLELFMADGNHYILNSKYDEDLIEVYSINTELLQFLLNKKLITYTNDVNDLSKFNDKKVLKKQKKGIFN